MFKGTKKWGPSVSRSCIWVFLAAVSVRAASFHYPVDLAVNRKGQIFVTDSEARSIFVISEGKTISLFAQGKLDFRSPLFREFLIPSLRSHCLTAAVCVTQEARWEQAGPPSTQRSSDGLLDLPEADLVISTSLIVGGQRLIVGALRIQ